MELTALENIKKIKKDAETLGGLIHRYNQKKNDERCDKYGLSFMGDDRFGIFSVPVTLSGWIGYYGNSNCTNLAYLISDKKEIGQAFLTALDENMEYILEEMSKLLLAKAASGAELAKAEIQKANDLLSELSMVNPTPSLDKDHGGE